MIFAQWRARRANRILIDQLHGKIVAASRSPFLYINLGVPDTFEGRFEMVTLYAGLVIRRLTQLSGIGSELAQELADSVFRHFEIALREIGIGDVAVPKRLKRMAEAFYGRNKAYGEGLDEHDSNRLAEALARNVYGMDEVALAPMALSLTQHVRATAEVLDQTPLSVFAGGDIQFLDPERILTKNEADNG
jgi:cytochrome b pre-mRNA-processing protein 3